MFLKDKFALLQQKKPLVHCITNYVTANDCANLLISAGASAIMADEVIEMEEITALSSSLNLNIGTLHSQSLLAMLAAGKVANQNNIPVILDPVGVGASSFRQNAVQNLIANISFSVIRGNISEIKSLFDKTTRTNGVDARIEDKLQVNSLPNAIQFAQNAAKQTGAIIVISGEIDIVANQTSAYVISNGHSMMPLITGTGCMLSALISGFIAADDRHSIESVVSAVCTMGICGEIAYQHLEKNDGPAIYRNKIIDALYHLKGDDIENAAKYQIF